MASTTELASLPRRGHHQDQQDDLALADSGGLYVYRDSPKARQRTLAEQRQNPAKVQSHTSI